MLENSLFPNKINFSQTKKKKKKERKVFSFSEITGIQVSWTIRHTAHPYL
jgi:hypothetical protein